MDYVRSCYATKMKFFTDSDLEIPVVWYFCDKDALPFPDYTRFASGNWASSKSGWDGVGEVEGVPRPWVNGRMPRNECNGQIFGQFTGKFFKGTSAQFANGCSILDPPLGALANGLCEACMPLPPVAWLTIISKRNLSPFWDWPTGEQIPLYQVPPGQAPTLDLFWTMRYPDTFVLPLGQYFASFNCATGPLTFGCGPHGMAMFSNPNFPIYPDFVAPDLRSFYWLDMATWFNCTPAPGENESWIAVLTFDKDVPPGPFIPFYPINFWPPFFWPGSYWG